MNYKFIGYIFALVAFTTWSLYPLLWAALQGRGAGSLEILSHRIVWAHLWCWPLWWLSRNRGNTIAGAPALRTWLLGAACGVLNIGNWLVCVWAATTSHMLEASLGYFMAPLLAAGMGVAFLGEQLRRLQKAAVAIAALMTLASVCASEKAPWVALLSGLSAAGYAALRKYVAMSAVLGTLWETAIFVPLAMGYLWSQNGSGVWGQPGAAPWLCILAGVMTCTALVSYASATARLPLSTLGVLQYVYPLGQLALGLCFFREPMTGGLAATLSGLVAALVLFWLPARIPTAISISKKGKP